MVAEGVLPVNAATSCFGGLLVTLQGTQWTFLPILAMGIFVGAALLSVAVVLRMLGAERVGEP